MSDETRPAAETTPTNGCTAEAQCPAMALALRAGGERGIGFHWATMLTMATGELESRLAYRLPKKTDGYSQIAVNHCPWCGAKVAP